MNYHHVRICLYETKGIIGSAIRWQTRSRWSHASLLLPDGSVLEAREGVGVRHVRHPDLRNATIYSVKSLTQEQSDRAIAWAMDQVGKRYDWLAVFRFVTRRRMTSNDEWFCSEYAYQAIEEGGLNLLHPTTEAWEVSPALLGRSPYLDEDWQFIKELDEI